jgi:hypothetical protein
LRQIGTFYLLYRNDLNRSPASLKDFVAYIKRDAPRESQALEEGHYVLVLNVTPTSSTVLAYERNAYTDGSRLVLMGDGSVKLMSGPEFQAALRVKG